MNGRCNKDRKVHETRTGGVHKIRTVAFHGTRAIQGARIRIVQVTMTDTVQEHSMQPGHEQSMEIEQDSPWNKYREPRKLERKRDRLLNWDRNSPYT
jgi:hypothetical protein